MLLNIANAEIPENDILLILEKGKVVLADNKISVKKSNLIFLIFI